MRRTIFRLAIWQNAVPNQLSVINSANQERSIIKTTTAILERNSELQTIL